MFMWAGRKLPLPINLQHTLWACGLRGAVAYGLAVNLPNIDAESDEGIPAIESATLGIVLVSTLLFGGITGETYPPPPNCWFRFLMALLNERGECHALARQQVCLCIEEDNAMPCNGRRVAENVICFETNDPGLENQLEPIHKCQT